jgi:hypothetical protein
MVWLVTGSAQPDGELLTHLDGGDGAALVSLVDLHGPTLWREADSLCGSLAL